MLRGLAATSFLRGPFLSMATHQGRWQPAGWAVWGWQEQGPCPGGSIRPPILPAAHMQTSGLDREARVPDTLGTVSGGRNLL